MVMFKDILPCADPQCTDKMHLVFQNERYVGYRCLLKPNSHNYRYDIKTKRWEKIIISTKPIIGYKHCPESEDLFERGLSVESI
jgi:hypothetical protein